MAARDERSESARFARSASWLSAGIGLAGLLTYAFFSLAAYSLSGEEYGEVVVLWSAVFVVISVLHRPTEQLLSRSIAERSARGEPTGPAIRAAARIALGVSLGWAIVALALRGPLTDDLLSGNETLYWILVTAVLGFAASFFARGYLAGKRRFGALAGVVIGESLGRMAFALAVAVGITDGQAAVALGIAAAPAISLFVVPFALGRRSAAPTGAAGDGGAGAETDRVGVGGGGTSRPTADRERGSGRFAAAVFCVMLSEQTLLNAGPLLVNALEGATLAGFIFNVLMVARAPLVVFQGVSTSLLPHLTGLRSSGPSSAREAFDRSVRATLLAIAAFTTVVVVAVAVVGPQVMQLAFSERFSYPRDDLVIVAIGMGLYLAATTLSQAALAGGLARWAAAAWLTSAISFLAWCLTGALEPAARVEIGFSAAAALLCGLLAALYPRARAGTHTPAETDVQDARITLSEEAGW
ncbi:MAG: hypothetical protein H0W09_08095 [Solirubrobacterales bacterium]|nr:hypothetical protein [Solirubrobacterales bacterium]